MATFDKRGDKWRAQVRRTGFKAKCKSFATKAAAEKWAREVEARLDRGVEVDTSELRKTTVAKLLQQFLDDEVPNRKGKRWETVRIKLMLKQPWAEHRLDQHLTPSLRAWTDERLKERSPATVNRDLNLLSGVFRIAIKKWGLPLPSNPVHGIVRPRVEQRSRGKVWSAEAVQKMRDAAAVEERREDSSYTFVMPALELSLETAMRLGEICAIQMSDVYLEDRYVVLRDTKNGDSRRVPLSSRAVEILKPLLERAAIAKRQEVFPVEKDTLGLRFRELRAKAGLEGLRFHDARHTAATKASKVFSNVLELAAFTGHRSLQSLKRYYHPDATDLAKRLG